MIQNSDNNLFPEKLFALFGIPVRHVIGRYFPVLMFFILQPVNSGVFAHSGEKSTGETYISAYKDLAIKEMKRTGIPASITIAQGMLESGNGNSRLARKANNHFGIKCHNWKGKKIYHDDDRKKECFRKYNSVHESYHDHSEFLRSTVRYAFLFEYDADDYKSWAKGLKKAGYATARNYDKSLIRIIETYNLYELDQVVISGMDEKDKIKWYEPSEQTIPAVDREIKTRNRIKYIVTKQGDTYQSVTEEMDMMGWQLAKYNDIGKGEKLGSGEILYIQPKRNRASRGNDYHIVKEGQTMHSISQKYGIKLKRLYKKNNMKRGEEPVTGQRLYLRKKKKGDIPQPVKEEIQFEFELE